VIAATDRSPITGSSDLSSEGESEAAGTISLSLIPCARRKAQGRSTLMTESLSQAGDNRAPETDPSALPLRESSSAISGSTSSSTTR
jgi:hypothetical protein